MDRDTSPPCSFQEPAPGWGGGGRQRQEAPEAGALHSGPLPTRGSPPRPPPSGQPGLSAALPAPASRASAQMPAPPRLLRVAQAAALCRSEITFPPAAGGPSCPGSHRGLPTGKWGARLSRGGQPGWADVLGWVVIRGCRLQADLGERICLGAVIIKLRSLYKGWSWSHHLVPAVPLQWGGFGRV